MPGSLLGRFSSDTVFVESSTLFRGNGLASYFCSRSHDFFTFSRSTFTATITLGMYASASEILRWCSVVNFLT